MRRFLRTAILLTIMEVALFVVLLRNATEGSLAIKVVPHLGAMIGAIATTWYVVFTYGLLESAERSRRQAAEPFVTVQWFKSSTPRATVVGNANLVSEYMKAFFQKMGLEVREAQTDQDRYITLRFENLRSVPVGILRLEIAPRLLDNPEMQIKAPPDWLISWDSESMPFGESRSFELTVLDLGFVPRSLEIELRIRKLETTAPDSREVLTAFGGHTFHNAMGVATPPDESSRIASEGGRGE